MENDHTTRETPDDMHDIPAGEQAPASRRTPAKRHGGRDAHGPGQVRHPAAPTSLPHAGPRGRDDEEDDEWLAYRDRRIREYEMDRSRHHGAKGRQDEERKGHQDGIPADEYDDDPMATPRDGLAPNTRGEYDGPSTPFKWWLTTGGDRKGRIDPDTETHIHRHIEDVAAFADWLCAVDRQVDDVLPRCWINHPWLVMLMDQLRSGYYAKWRDGRDGQGPYYWISSVQQTISWIQQWSQATNIMSPDHTCHPHDTTVSASRIARRAAEERAGFHAIRATAWPPSEARDAALAALTLADPWTGVTAPDGMEDGTTDATQHTDGDDGGDDEAEG